MQSEPRRPDGVLNVRWRARGEEGAKDRDSFMRTGLTLHVDPTAVSIVPTRQGRS